MGFFIERDTSPAPDGVNATFTLTTSTASVSGTMRPHLQGVLVVDGDFTEDDATTFTLAVAPRAGDQVRAFFELNDLTLGDSMIETPIGVIDGVNRRFTTPTAPYVSGETRVIINGVTQPPDVIDEIDASAGTFDVLTTDPPDAARDSLLVFWVFDGGPVLACPITVVVTQLDEVAVVVTEIDEVAVVVVEDC